MEHTAVTSLLSLEFQATCASFVLAFTISRNNKGVCSTCLFFGNFPDPRGLGGARTLRYAWLYPRQSQASLGGYYGGNPRTSPKKSPTFFRKISVSKFLVYLGKTGARHEQLRYGSAYASGIWHPPHHLTPKSLMNAKFLAEVYQSRIREHGNRVKKTRARTHKASMGHTVDLRLPISYIHKYYYDKVLTYYMGSEAQTTYRLSSPPCGSSTASNSAMGGCRLPASRPGWWRTPRRWRRHRP